MTLCSRLVALTIAGGLVAAPLALAAPAAQAAPGTTSLAEVLLADTDKDGNPTFDGDGKDFDILTAAVLAVLAADPYSPVAVLTNGDVRLTAFLPTDGGFARTAKDLGITAKNEQRLTSKLVSALGVDGIEEVLLYHVVPGVKINAKTAAQSDGAVLAMANGQNVKVNVAKSGIFLRDRAKGVANPQVVVTDINKGNKQIAHAINRVLLPNL